MINYSHMKTLLESILLEDKLSDLQNRYSHIHPDTVKDIWNNGVPSNNQGKYIDWAIKENSKSHNPNRTKLALEIYDRNKDKIGKFNHQWSVDDLESVTHPYTDEGKSFNKKAEEGTSIHYEDDDIVVKQHSNHPSAVKAGFLHVDNSCYDTTNEPGKAQWCVSANSEEGQEYFNDYTENSKYPLYTIENKKDKSKSAIVLNPNRSQELRDEYDNELSPYQVIYKHPSIINSQLGNKLLNIGNTRDVLDKVPAKATEEMLLKGLNDNNSYVRKAVINHPKATEQMLLKGLDDSISYRVRNAAVSHPKATEQVLLKGLNDSNWSVRNAAVSHPKATEQVLLKGLDDSDWSVREAAIRHPKATEQMLLKGLNDNNSYVRKAVINHPKATEQMLLKGINDSDSYVRSAAISHPNATEQMLLKGINDSDWFVKGAAISHPKVTERVLLKGLNDSHLNVRKAVIRHPKVTEQVLLKGLDDNNPDIRSIARERLANMKKDS